MRLFHFKAGRAFCLAAALSLSLAPFLLGLHLSMLRHGNGIGHPQHDPGASNFHHGCAGLSEQVAPPCATGREERDHDFSSCPLCKAFAQLLSGGWIIHSNTVLVLEKPPVFLSYRTGTVRTTVSLPRSHPRAPPV